MTTSSRGMPGWLILMGVLTMTGPLAIDMYLPAFPTIAGALATDVAAVERTLAIYLIGMAVGQLAYGPLSDRFGRKPPLYVGLALFSVASAACAAAQSIETLTAWRLVQALGGSACMVVPRAVIRDHYNTQAAARAMSLLMLIIGVAPILAPVIGGQILQVASWRVIFGLLALIGVALMIAMHVAMTETVDRSKAARIGWRSVLGTYAALLRHRQFMTTALAGGLGMGCLFAYVTGSPQVLIEVYGVSPQRFSLLFALNAGSLIVASQVNARLLARRQPQALMRPAIWVLPGIGLVALACSVAGWLPLAALMVCLMAVMATQGFIGPNSAALALSQQSGRLGAASALLGTIQFTCGTLVGLGLSLWRTPDATSLVAVIALCGLLAHVFGRIGLRLSSAAAPATH